jgi:hypothetical protein
MLLFTHTAMGILLAGAIQNPYIAAVSALTSHYLLDIIPHEPEGEIFYIAPDKRQRDPEINKKLKRRSIISIFDLLISSVLIYLFFLFFGFNNFFSVSLIVFFSLLPDILTVLAVLFPFSFLKFHHKYHFKLHELIKLKLNYLTAYGFQLIFSLILFFITFKILR